MPVNDAKYIPLRRGRVPSAQSERDSSRDIASSAAQVSIRALAPASSSEIETVNRKLLTRFSRSSETWAEITSRVVSLSRNDSAGASDAIRSGGLMPSGQILRGAGDSKKVLYSSYAVARDHGETFSELVQRITEWTAPGVGVGVNLSDQMSVEDSSFLRAVTEIGRSQNRLWEAGIRRTATMVVVDFGTANIAEAAQRITVDPTLRHLNLAVNVSDDSMSSLEEDGISGPRGDLRTLAQSAWACGNPGFVFIDRVNRDRAFPERLAVCNACAEQFLLPNEGSPLASVNLAAFADRAGFDFDGLEQTARLAVRFLDDVIDASAFPSSCAEKLARNQRRIGVGVMGLDTALRRMGVPYDTPDAVSVSSDLATRLHGWVVDESQRLSAELGNYADFERSFVPVARRNVGLLSIAPTGGISALIGVSSGIEPLFGAMVETERGLMQFDTGSIGLPLKHPGQIGWQWHINHLAAWQARVDGGISKTVNLPHEFTVQEVEHMLARAWLQGSKAVSLFRASSRPSAMVAL